MINLKILCLVINIWIIVILAEESEDDKFQCSKLYEYDASTPGTISSPFYGKRNYHRMLWCEYRIKAPEGHRIKLTFKDFDIGCESDKCDCLSDKLIVYSKDKEQELDVMCGSKLPFPILSNEGENEIRILFRTHDESKSKGGRGFLLEYESSPNFKSYCEDGQFQCKNRNCYTEEQKCNEVDDCGDGTDEVGCEINDENFNCRKLYEFDATIPGNITSPFYGKREKYHQGLWCEYRIFAPEGYRIRLIFKKISIHPTSGCIQDKLVVFDKTQQDVLNNICGYEAPHPVLSKAGENEVRLFFQTGRMSGAKGFVVEYEASPYINDTCLDGGTECRNRNCYKREQKCNGIDDCGDGTDEEDCDFAIDTVPEECGVQEIKPIMEEEEGSDRMVGGEEAVPNSWPWQVSLQRPQTEPNEHFCGGTLINSQWVLTAAHCVKLDPNPYEIRIHMGAHSKFHKTPYEQIRRSKKIIAYPDLEGSQILSYPGAHDIALIKLNAPIKFNKGVQPACLPSSDMTPPPGTRCYVTGWGQTRGSGSAGRLKQQVQIVQPRATCGFYESQICVGYPKRSLCHGDSGGPLNCKVDEKWYVFGAVSLLIPANWMSGLCGGPDAKTLYASSIHKAEWIRMVIHKYN